MVDAVASLAAEPMHVDKQRIDICFSGSQKAISAPPGMSPITVSPRAEEVFRTRKSKVQSWYFDLSTAMNYWGKDRLYHHTPPISLIYALREAMRIVLEEGLEARWAKHKLNQQALIAGVEALNLKLFVENPKDRLTTVTAVVIPSGIDDAKLRNQLLDEFNIEIAGGIGAVKGQIWRLGLMGYCSQKPFVLQLLAAMEKCLIDQGHRVSPGAGVGAALTSRTLKRKPPPWPPVRSAAFSTWSSPSQRAMTALARQLPVTFTEVRAISITASTPRIRKIGSVGR